MSSEIGYSPVEAEKTASKELTREQYLARLPSEDRQNLEKIIGKVESYLQKSNVKARILAVGGSIDKLFPRKDIDLLVSKYQEDSPKGTELEVAQAAYSQLEEMIRAIVQEDPSLVITKKIEPFIDHEFGDENILAHGGSAEMTPSQGTVIELINDYRPDTTDAIRSKNARPFVVLLDSKTSSPESPAK